MPSKQKNLREPSSANIRIIAGRWRGRKLPVNSEKGLRPTGDRIRETLFNWLAPYVAGSRCLDAYAGTGALGFEALSRGADMAHFVEINESTAQQLQSNVHILGGNARVSCTDFTRWHSGEVFDLIFVDPPFADNLWQRSIDHISGDFRLSPDTLIYAESPLDTMFDVPCEWSLFKSKSAGQVTARLYKTSPTV